MSHPRGEEIPRGQSSNVVIRTVPEMMRYGLKEFSVPAGKKVKFLLLNPDNMPHNLVLTAVGALEEVGLLADKSAADPKFVERHYVPDSRKVLFATEMVDDHSQAILEFVAPDKPGDYPFLCTFPGHWRLMQGVMKVIP